MDVIYDQDTLVATGVPTTVDVTIEGPRQVVQQAKAVRDFRVFLNLSDLSIGRHQVALQHEGLSSRLRVTLSHPVADIYIDERVTEEFRVDPEFNNAIIPDGYELDALSVNPQTVEITGAKNVIESIRYVRASIDLNDPIDEEATVESQVQVLDQNLDKLSVSVDPPAVEVTISVTQPSKEVALVANQTGTIAEGLEVASLTLNDDAVTIYGQADALAEIDEIPVTFDLTGIEQSGSRIEVPIPLPDGVSRLSQQTASAIVIFNEVEEAANPDSNEQSVGEQAPSSNEGDQASNPDPDSDTIVDSTEEEQTLSGLPVEVRGVSDDLRTAFIEPPSGELDLRVTGEQAELAEISEEDVSLYVDMTDLDEGEHELEVQIDGPANVTYILSQPSIRIELAKV
ncbi:hypothetical protein KP78_01580 [Jeotgalibacillus soli]|uniref:YbbR family protein n=1 Tax=Jeotgalibacillus soli TaxID=889306 RepID=A0A0C2W6X6_9BACL|nr:hypothetical protein KP78_01580 [Jeotgalibacillus soli]